MLILFAFSIYKLYYLFNRYGAQLSKTTLIRLPDEEESFRPQDGGFDFAFGLKNKLDPQFGYFTVNFINQTVS